jgi:predicted transcriptional regulator
MSKHSRADLCTLLGITQAYISVNIKRGKLILNDDGEIDDSKRENADFIKKRLGTVTNSETNEEVKEQINIPAANIQRPDSRSANNNTQYSSKYDLETTKKSLEIEKLKVDTRIQELKEEKIRAEVIPIVIVKNIFIQHSQNTITEFKNAVDNVLTVIAKQKSLNGNEVAEIRGQLVQIINIAVDKAVNTSKKNINNIVKEFSNKKDVGERE